MLTAATVQIAACLKLARALARTETIEEVYAIALDVLSEPLAVTRSSILLLNDDGVMRFGESRGLTDAFRQALEGTLPWTADTLDPQPVVVSDVTLEPALARHVAMFQADGIAALVFMPLVSLGRVTGAIVLGYDRPDALEADAVQMATLVASQVAFAAERTRALEHARRSESRLRFALDAVNMGTWEWDLRSQSIRWSENLERIHGITPGSFDGTFEGYRREIHTDDRAYVLASLQQTLSDGSPYEV